jgi:cation diffusion facilitator CzcD-associated flavoprotein CzcO
MAEASTSATRKRRIGILGAGPGGICAAIMLKAAGWRDVTVFERSSSVGGTWWLNTYPGCACDIPSHLYCFSFEPSTEWARPYGSQSEILGYLRFCVEKYGLGSHLRLGSGVAAAHWEDARSEWRVVTDGGEHHRFDALVSAVGMFNDLRWPDIPGLQSFAGPIMHSARWDHGCDLAGRTVAVVGAAASAVQLVPEVAKVAGRVLVFQRSPNWVVPKPDTPYTEEQLACFRSDPAAIAEERRKAFGWVNAAQTFSIPEILLQQTESGLKNISAITDPELRGLLTPSYPFGCKRPLIANDWYPAFNRANVELVSEPIEKVTADSVVTRQSHPVDVVVVATGFETTRFLSTVTVTGRNGVLLANEWNGGAEAYLGLTVAGFPNLFMLYGPNTNNGSILFMIECQVAYLLRHLDRLDSEGLAWMDVHPSVQRDYNRRLQHDLDQVDVWRAGTCDNYYRSPSGRIVTQWPHGMSTYKEWTERPDFDAYEVGT